ncbi:MAG: ATP-dependent helicase, partial [Anaerolineae bacterium]|nr:ATP-dependent helicase [Anaerolineae bacterium]
QVEAARKMTEEDSNEVFVNYADERKVWLQIVSGIRPSSTLEAFLQELEMRSKAPDPDQNTVKLMTIHGAKGQEFFYVYLIGMVEGELPSFQSVNQGDKSPEMEEERRNCFVAITRVQQTLTLSYSTRFGNWDKKPSRFLFEMGLLELDF